MMIYSVFSCCFNYTYCLFNVPRYLPDEGAGADGEKERQARVHTMQMRHLDAVEDAAPAVASASRCRCVSLHLAASCI